MRIAWDLQAVTGPHPTGLGHAVRLLLDAARTHLPDVAAVELRPNKHDLPLRGVPDRLAWEQWRLPRRLVALRRQGQAELLYAPALGAPLASALPVVVHVHDLIQLHYRAQYHGVAGWYWQRLLPLCWRRARAITVSNASLVDDVAQSLAYPAQRIHIVPFYADPELARLADELDPQWRNLPVRQGAPLFITLGSQEPRKNLALAIEALARSMPQLGCARLVLAGGHTAATGELRELAARRGVADSVDFPGYLTRQEAVRLMLSSTALLFPSRYEGFGMPPQEAQSLGCPVVLSDIACHRCVYDDPARREAAGLGAQSAPPFVGLDDAAALAQAMVRLAQDGVYRAQQRQAGLEYQATFNSLATAHALQAAWRSALGGT